MTRKLVDSTTSGTPATVSTDEVSAQAVDQRANGVQADGSGWEHYQGAKSDVASPPAVVRMARRRRRRGCESASVCGDPIV